MQPRPRHAPVALDRAGRYAQCLRRLLHAEAGEEAQLDDPRLLRVEGGQPFKRLVEGDQVNLLSARHAHRLVERESDFRPAALLRPLHPRVVDEDAAHQVGGDGEEVGAALPRHVLRVHQPEVRLVDERRGLERVTGALAPEVARRLEAQLLVDERDEPVERLPVTAPPLLKELRHAV